MNRRTSPRIWTKKRRAEKRGRARRRRQEIADQLRAIQSIPQFIKGLRRFAHAAGRASLTLSKMGANFARVGREIGRREYIRRDLFLDISRSKARITGANIKCVLSDDIDPRANGEANQ